MEKKAKQIVAIVVIAGIAVGAGLGTWIYFAFFATPYWVAPGAPATISEDQMIKVGCLGDLNNIQGAGNYDGAYFAAKQINEAGGVTVGGKTYYVAIGKEDTAEARAPFDTALGVAAAERLLARGAEYFVGGFRTEVLEAYLEPVMDAKKLFFGTGAATDSLCKVLETQYEKYKYFFRVMPINSTALGNQVVPFILGLMAGLNSTFVNEDIDTAVVLRENLDWTAEMGPKVAGALLNNSVYNFTTTYDMPYNPASTANDFDSYWGTIEGYGAHLVIPIISAGTGVYMMTKYAERQPNCTVVGINVESQLDSYWEETSGAAIYETMMQPLVRTNKTPVSIEFWDAYHAYYDSSPLYTATGAYDAVRLLIDVINTTKSFDISGLINGLEDGVWHDFSPMTNTFQFTSTHDVRAWMEPGDNKDYAQTLMVQWQTGGAKYAVDQYVPVLSFYPVDMEVGTYQVAPWVAADWAT